MGIHTVIDTAGNPFTRKEPFFSKFEKLMQVTDLLLLDIKHIDEEQHKLLTGKTNQNILDMARYLSDIGKPVWIRHVLVPERSDQDEYLDRLHEFLVTLKNVERVEVLPYHTLGEYKWEQMGIPYPLKGIDPPTKERIRNAEERLGIK
jgi:pyruvate formate lyase activating enzyme